MVRRFGFVFIILSAIVGIAMLQFSRDTERSITVEMMLEKMQSDTSLVFLDVRTREEWNSPTGHLKDALLIPIQELESRLHELEQYKQKTIIAYCRSGNRSRRATEYLTKAGFNVLNLQGGMLKWNAEHYPAVLERRQ